MTINKRHISILAVALCMILVLAATANTFLTSKSPVYLIDLPAAIAAHDSWLVDEVSIYSAQNYRHGVTEVSFYYLRENITFEEIILRVVNPISPFPVQIHGDVLRGGHKVNLIGYLNGTLYVEVVWDNWMLYMQYEENFSIYEPAFYDALILTLTSISNIEQVQFMVCYRNRTGNMWEELSTPRSRENLFSREGYVVIIEN
jgi:hypothetical protein